MEQMELERQKAAAAVQLKQQQSQAEHEIDQHRLSQSDPAAVLQRQQQEVELHQARLEHARHSSSMETIILRGPNGQPIGSKKVPAGTLDQLGRMADEETGLVRDEHGKVIGRKALKHAV